METGRGWKRYCAQRSLTTCPCSGFLDPEDPTMRGFVLLPRGLPPPPAPATIFQFRGQWKRKDQAFLKDQAGSCLQGSRGMSAQELSWSPRVSFLIWDLSVFKST